MEDLVPAELAALGFVAMETATQHVVSAQYGCAPDLDITVWGSTEWSGFIVQLRNPDDYDSVTTICKADSLADALPLIKSMIQSLKLAAPLSLVSSVSDQ